MSPPGLATGSDGGGGVMGFLRKHEYHFLTVFLVEQADHVYEERVGPPSSPRFFGSPLGIDRAVLDRYSEPSRNRTFIAQNKTAVMQGVSLGAMLWVNGRDWWGLADDVVGFIEAHKFNWATSSLVKNIAGRRRPGFQQAVEEMDAERISGASVSNRESFYSDATSKAFTYMAYTDSVLARRLEGHRAARVWSAIGLYGLATYVAYTRIEQGKHYFTDVVAGAGAGFLVGKTFYRLNHKKKKEDDRRAEVRVQPLLFRGGAGVSVSVEF